MAEDRNTQAEILLRLLTLLELDGIILETENNRRSGCGKCGTRVCYKSSVVPQYHQLQLIHLAGPLSCIIANYPPRCGFKTSYCIKTNHELLAEVQ